MKSLIISLILFSFVLGAVIINAFYAKGVCGNIGELAEKLKSADECDALIENMKEIWSDARPILELSIRLNEIERMNDLIESLEASYLSENPAEFQKHCRLISELTKELISNEKISLKSIC